MWHEARKQERKLRGIMVNYKKRAERRRAFYEKMKADPTTFLRVQGTNYKIYIDYQNTASDDSINMMPWQGDRSVMIDRFDVRAHLDYIPPCSTGSVRMTAEQNIEEQKFNYERYRTLVMIEASGGTEETYLRQLEQEEQNPKVIPDGNEKKEKAAPKASIGYTYQNSAVVMGDDESESSDDDSDLDLDIDVAVNVDELDTEQKDELNKLAVKFDIQPGKYCSLLKTDKDEAELVQRVKEEEEARGQLRGRRAKRDRRSLKDQQRALRSNSPLSFVRRASPSYEPYRESRSRSKSTSSSSGGEPSKVEYITEFGSAGETKDAAASLPTGDTHSRKKSSSKREQSRKHRSRRDSKRSRSRSKSQSRSRSRSRGRERSRSRGWERSRSRDHDRSRSSRYYRSRSEEHHSRRSRDKSRSRSHSRSRRRRRSSSSEGSRSRSRSRESHARYSRDSDSRRRYAKDDGDKGRRSLEGISKVLGGTKTKTALPGDKSKLTPQEKLKKRMQLALNKQLKIDKKEERKKKEIKEQERQARDEDLREISRKWKDQRKIRLSRSRSPSPGGWTNKVSRRRSSSPDDRRYTRSRSRSASPTQGVPLSPVDMDSHIEGEDVVHYVYEK